MSTNQTIDGVLRELLERISARLNETGQFLLAEELHAALAESVPIIGGEVARLNGMLDAASELLRTKQRVNRELRSELERIKAINDNNFKLVSDRLFEPAAPVVEGQDDQQMACMPVERCYDVRAKMIIAFNEAKKAGGDLDDALDAAYKSALRYSPNPMSTQSQDKPVACSHEWTDDGGYLLVCTACGTQEDHDPGWQDMDSAPRDGTILRLLVEFEDHSTEDADQAPTIGANNFDNDGEDRWKFAGSCWSHDHFTEGRGIPVGWLPMLEVKTTGIAEQPAPMPTPDDREELIGQLADEIGRLGMCSAADRELFERIIDANYRKQVAT